MEEIKKKWSKKEVRTFISRYKSYRLLWDSKTINYRNKIEKRLVQNQLSKDFNTTVTEINKKIYILRTQFFYEYKKVMKDRKSLDIKNRYISKWEHYKALKFLLCEDWSDSDNSVLSDDEDGDHQDEYQMFGNYVASELRSMHFEKNIIELKRLIQQHIIQWTEADDKEYYAV